MKLTPSGLHDPQQKKWSHGCRRFDAVYLRRLPTVGWGCPTSNTLLGRTRGRCFANRLLEAEEWGCLRGLQGKIIVHYTPRVDPSFDVSDTIDTAGVDTASARTSLDESPTKYLGLQEISVLLTDEELGFDTYYGMEIPLKKKLLCYSLSPHRHGHETVHV